MGDFNSILSPDDRPIGSQVQLAEMKDFREYVNQCNLVELPTVEKEYTWTNGHVYSRIDKALVNDEWVITMLPKQVRIIESMLSDHSPLSIVLSEHQDNYKRPFKFYNCLAQHQEFKERVKKGWTTHRRGMQGIWKNLKRVKKKEMQR